MKKLMTLFIISSGVNLCLADSAIKVGLEGMIKFEAGTRNQTSYYDESALLSQNNKDLLFKPYVNLGLRAEGILENSFVKKYGAIVKLATTVKDNFTSKSRSIDKTYFYLETDIGKFELGSNYSAASIMHVSAGKISSGWKDFANLDMFDGTTSVKEHFIKSESLYSDAHSSALKRSEDTRKLTYYTPKYNNLQFGISYIPDSATHGDGISLEDPKATPLKSAKNILNGGIQYDNQVNPDLRIRLSLIADYADKKIDTINGVTMAARKNLFSYGSSIAINARNFGFGISYGNWGKSLLADINPQFKPNPYFYTIGASYNVNNKLALGLTHFRSSISDLNSKRNFEYNGISAEYKIMTGVAAYGDIVRFTQKSTNPNIKGGNPKNKGTIIALGTKFNF